MIDLEHNRVIRGDTLTEPIREWKTWFKTPFGYCETAHEAVNVCKENDVDPIMCVVPVAVAITTSTHEVWER